jgi:hypothetical protein
MRARAVFRLCKQMNRSESNQGKYGQRSLSLLLLL